MRTVISGLLSSFRGRLFVYFLVVAALALTPPAYYVNQILNESLLQGSVERLQQEAALVQILLAESRTRNEKAELFNAVKRADIRLTLIDPKGAVLLDSDEKDVSLLDNHLDRPEVIQAVEKGKGSSVRLSTTLRNELLYAALRLEDGNILRLAAPLAGVKQRINAQLAVFFLAAAGAIVLSLLMAWFFSSQLEHSLSRMMRVVEAISLGNFSRRLRVVPGKEFQPLADAVNRMAKSTESFIRAEADQRGQLEAILETMAEGVLVLDPKGRIRRVNKALVASFPAAARADGRQAIEVIPSPALQDSLHKLIQDEEGYGKSLVLQITLKGTVFFVLLARPPKEAADSLGAVAVFHDITELARLEAVRRDFVANVSHELRIPLTALQGYAETMASLENMPEDGLRFAKIIQKHGMFLSKMVDELLILSRLESANFHPEHIPVDPAQALRSAVQALHHEIEGKNLKIAEELEEGLRVITDPGHLERVFRNLLDNACRYAPEGSEIKVRGQKQNGEALFSVSDQGPGIPEEDLGRIFERFYRVEKHRGVNSGLGLAICKHMLECHEGRIWAESPAKDAATTFFFTLPLTPSGDAA